jgi:CubicO group peptidase (beta-lactamase class C family)
VIISLILLTILYIWLSGNHYLFFLLRHTVLQGRLGPDIHEYGIYENRLIANEVGIPWPEQLSLAALSNDDMDYLKEFGTVAFLVIRRDTIVWEYRADEYSDTSHYNLWSATKSIVSLLVGCAIDDGYIKSVNQPIEDFLHGQYIGSGITIRHLLTMSSGIDFDESYINPFSYSARGLYANDFEELNENYGPLKEPGKTFDYQSGNTQLLGTIVTKASGMTLSAYASKKLWKPMHAMEPAFWSLDHANGMERCFCCFNTNARDFARIGKLLLHDGVWDEDTLISSSYLQEAVRPADLLDENGNQYLSYGYQWWTLVLEDYKGYYARGIQGQYVFVLPAEDLIIVRQGYRRNTIPSRGHITDVFRYLDMGRSIVAQIK